MAVQRTLRLNELLKRALSEILQNAYRDRKVPWMTVSRVDVTKDLRFCKVSFTVLGDEAAEKTALKILKEDTPKLRYALGRKVELRIVPNLQFVIDNDLKEALYVDSLIQKTEAASTKEPE